MSKLVSVIIPAYNAEKYINKCVQSVIDQSYQELEIIIVNDGSKDNTLKILKSLELKDSRILVIDQTNQGLPAARNTGLRKCKGDFIFFLDSDDWLELNCIEFLMNIESKSCADIIFFDYFKNYGNKETEHHAYENEFIYNSDFKNRFVLWDMRTITAWGKLYSRKCIANTEYDEKMRTAEDVDFNYRIYKNVKTAYFSNKCLLHYRILEQSAIHGYDPNVRSKFSYPLKEIASYMITNNEEDLKAYYSFAAIAYIVICQNGVVQNSTISYKQKLSEIKEISKETWAKDLFDNIKYVTIPVSRKIIIRCSKMGLFSVMILAANVRKRLKR